MYQFTWKLFALFPLVLPIFAATEVEGANALQMRAAHSGTGTRFTPGAGSCGGTNNADQLVAALSVNIMNKNADCGKTVRIKSNGKTVKAQIVDICDSCGPTDLGLSSALFQQLGSPNAGSIPIEWDGLN